MCMFMRREFYGNSSDWTYTPDKWYISWFPHGLTDKFPGLFQYFLFCFLKTVELECTDKSQNHPKYLSFPVCSKFPDFSLTGICLPIFQVFQSVWEPWIFNTNSRKIHYVKHNYLVVGRLDVPTECRPWMVETYWGTPHAPSQSLPGMQKFSKVIP